MGNIPTYIFCGKNTFYDRNFSHIYIKKKKKIIFFVFFLNFIPEIDNQASYKRFKSQLFIILGPIRGFKVLKQPDDSLKVQVEIKLPSKIAGLTSLPQHRS